MSYKPIFAAICFSLALGLLLFVVWPKYQELSDLNQEVQRTEERVEKSKDYVDKLNDLSGKLDEHSKQMKKVNSALPEKPGIPSLLDFLYSSASDKQGLLLRNVGSISKSNYQGNIKKININLELGGSYSSFKDFLKITEKTSRIIEVENVSFNIPEEDEKVPPRFEVSLSTFFYASQ